MSKSMTSLEILTLPNTHYNYYCNSEILQFIRSFDNRLFESPVYWVNLNWGQFKAEIWSSTATHCTDPWISLFQMNRVNQHKKMSNSFSLSLRQEIFKTEFWRQAKVSCIVSAMMMESSKVYQFLSCAFGCVWEAGNESLECVYGVLCVVWLLY